MIFFFFLQLFFFKESDKLSQWKIFWPQKIKKVGPKFMYAKKLYIWNQERGGKEEEELESNYIISTNQRPLNNFKKCQKERKKLKIINYKLNFQKKFQPDGKTFLYDYKSEKSN